MKSINIQDQFLNQIRKENTFVTVFLLNGFQLRGQVKGFDNFTVLIESEGKQQLIYKHAISTFAPQKTFSSNWNSDSRTKRPCLAWFFQIA
ncbi:RNA chaperone Hfq [Bacillus licheniformis]|nr:RNA chaperone Hfq [Bacillus licheniformis]VEH78197.1 Hfq-like RNA chaperone [Bacillus licheniformis]